MIDYQKEGELHLVTMNNGPNTICPDWQQRMLDILDRVEGDCDQGASLGTYPVQTSSSAMA